MSFFALSEDTSNYIWVDKVVFNFFLFPYVDFYVVGFCTLVSFFYFVSGVIV